MENGVKVDANDLIDIGSEKEMNEFMKNLEENEVFEEASLDQESFYTPASRHVASDSKDSQDLVFEEVINSGDIDVDGLGKKNESFESELNGVEMKDKQLEDDLNGSENTEEVEIKLNGVEVGDTVNEEKPENGHTELVDEDVVDGDNYEEIGNVLLVACDDMNVETVMESKGLVDTSVVGNGEELDDEKALNGDYNGVDQEVENVSVDASAMKGVESIMESEVHSNPIISENGAKELDDEKSLNVECNSVDFEVDENVSVDVSDTKSEESITESEEHANKIISEISAKELAEEKCQNVEYSSDELGTDLNTESKEQNPSDEVVENIVNGQTSNTHSLSVQPSVTITETDNGSIAKSYASVVKDGSAQPKQAKASLSAIEAKEIFDKESVLVEDVNKSSSNEGEESMNASKQAPPTATTTTATAHSESNGGLNLPARPAGLGSSAPLREPASRSIQQTRANGIAPQRHAQVTEEPSHANDDAEENDETREKLQNIRVKFLRLTHRLGQTPHNVVVAQVLYRLGLAEHIRRNTNSPAAFSFDRASVMAEQIEATGIEPLDFSCTILVIGKTGVGKSATINSIFDECRLQTDAFQVATKKVQDIVGTVQGIKIRIIDTPGLYPSSADQLCNEKILRSAKKFISKTPPDIVLYFDRLDMQSRDYGDVPLLKSITNVFGSSIWFNAIIVLTHAASAPPDGPNGVPLSYEMFVSQRSHVVQQAIRQAAQDLRLMNPVSLVENHSACRMNRAGQRVLPNGQVWKPHLLLLSFASKILAEANTLLQLQDAPPGRPRARTPPLPYFLSSLLHSRAQLKLPEEQFGDDFTIDGDLDESSDSDDGNEYDDLPPFKTLNNSQLAKLSKQQKKAYFEELEYREKLFFWKQLKEEKIRRKLMKKMAEAVKDLPEDNDSENVEDENSSQASLPVTMPDLPLPTSFDSDNPTHRYRALDTSSQWAVRPVLENHVWDHDVGYDGLNVERLFAVKNKIPVSFSGQLTKDKKECTFQAEVASSIKHGEAGATSLGLDMQTVGKDMAYTLRGETKVKNFRRNNTAAGVSLTLLGDAMSAGVKVEDNLIVNKRLKLLMSGGAMTSKGDVAYGGRIEATLRDKDYPVGRSLSTLALNAVDWHGDTTVACNLQSQIPMGRGTNVIGNANFNNKGTGQVGIRFNSSDQLQIALLALLPLCRHIKRTLFDSSQMD